MLRRSGTLRVDNENPGGKGLGIILILLALLLTLGVGAYLYLYTGVFDTLLENNGEVATEATPTTIPAPTTAETATEASPTEVPTPEPTQAPGTYSIQILNGNGIAGSAGEAQTLLEAKGYKVISAANATRFDYSSTEIQAKPTVPDAFIADLQTALATKYTVTVSDNLASDNEADIVVIVGK